MSNTGSGQLYVLWDRVQHWLWSAVWTIGAVSSDLSSEIPGGFATACGCEVGRNSQMSENFSDIILVDK